MIPLDFGVRVGQKNSDHIATPQPCLCKRRMWTTLETVWVGEHRPLRCLLEATGVFEIIASVKQNMSLEVWFSTVRVGDHTGAAVVLSWREAEFKRLLRPVARIYGLAHCLKACSGNQKCCFYSSQVFIVALHGMRVCDVSERQQLRQWKRPENGQRHHKRCCRRECTTLVQC